MNTEGPKMAGQTKTLTDAPRSAFIPKAAKIPENLLPWPGRTGPKTSARTKCTFYAKQTQCQVT